MNKTKSFSFLLTSIPRFYFILLFLIILLLVYWFFPCNSPAVHGLADISRLPQSSFFTYINISSQVHFSPSQGLLYVPPRHKNPHFGSIKRQGVRGNHRHKDKERSISGEVIILLQGQFQVRIGDGDMNKYEDHQFDICKTGIIAIKFTADKCHALKNIGSETNWFASYYIKSKEITTPSVDRESCKKMLLT